MFVDSGTKLCKYCSGGEYYDSTAEKCLSCGVSCKKMCAYKLACFQCPSSGFYDLTSRTCKPACSSTQVALTGAQFHNLKLCRDLIYHVDPTSTEILELGTKAFPYKNLGSPFVEIFNHLIDQPSKSVTIFIKENTDNEFLQGSQVAVNVGKVTLAPYSLVNPSAPAKATLTGKDKDVAIHTLKTRFNILANSNLDKAAHIASNKIKANEKAHVGVNWYSFLFIRTSFEFKNLKVTNALSAADSSTTVFGAVQLQAHTMTLSHIDFAVQGALLLTSDPLNIDARHINVDFTRSTGGYIAEIPCNYPEAQTVGHVLWDNHTFWSADPRTGTLKNGYISYNGPANITLTNSKFFSYSTKAEGRSGVSIRGVPACRPDDAHTTLIKINHNHLKLAKDPNKQRYQDVYVTYEAAYKRKVLFEMNHNFFDNLIETQIPAVGVRIYEPRSLCHFDHNMHRNSSAHKEIAVYKCLEVVAINNTYEDCWSEGYTLVELKTAKTSLIDGLYFYRNRGSTSLTRNTLFMTQLNDQSNLTLKNMIFKNNSLNVIKALSIESPFNKLEILDSVFENEKMSGGITYVAMTFTVRQIVIRNCTIKGFRYVKPTDQNAVIFRLDKIQLDNNMESSIQDVRFIDSEVNFLKFSGFSNTPPAPKVFLMDKIQLIDCTFNTFATVMQTTGYTSDKDVTVKITNSKIQNLKFNILGNIMTLNHQSKTKFIMDNVTFSSNVGGGVVASAANKQNTAMPLKVEFTKSSIIGNNPRVSPFFQVKENSEFYISTSTFTDNYNYEQGSVLCGQYQKTKTYIVNSTFERNQGVSGGVFCTQSESMIECRNCTIKTNFALNGGVIQSRGNGFFKFINSTIEKNYALQIPVADIFDVSSRSVIDSSVLRNNIGMTRAQIMSEIKDKFSCVRLCFLNANFIAYLKAHMNLLDRNTDNNIIKVVNSELEIKNFALITNQSHILESINGRIFVTQSTIKDTSISSPVFNLVRSNFTADRMTVTNVTSTTNQAMIEASLTSTVTIGQSTIQHNSIPCLALKSSNFISQGTTYKNISNPKDIFLFDNSKVTLSGSKFMNLTSATKSPLRFKQVLPGSMITNCEIEGIRQVCGEVRKSTMTMMNITVKQSYKGFTLYDSNIVIDNSSFIALGSTATTIKKGGAVYSLSSNVTIDRSTFERNTAVDGAAVSLNCELASTCALQVKNSIFRSNSASHTGGAINYNMERPLMSNNTYMSNTAPYGPDISSYATRVQLFDTSNSSHVVMKQNGLQMTIGDVASGQALTQKIQGKLLDHDGQIMVLDSQSQIVIKELNSSSTALGKSIVKVSRGEGSFEGLLLIGTPGTNKVQFTVTSNAMDMSKLRKVYGANYSQPSLEIDFRWCTRGEALEDKQCKMCNVGLYSLHANSTRCFECPKNSECTEGAQIKVDQGYWRSSVNSTNIVKCLNEDACLGGYEANLPSGVKCQQGYDGVLCTKCIPSDGFKYERLSSNQCTRCPATFPNAIRLIGFIIILIIAVIVMILINVNKKGESNLSVLSRISTNYLQIVASAMSFNLNYPQYLLDIFTPVSAVGNSQEAIVSMDCLITDATLEGFSGSIYIFKVFMSIFIPPALIILSFVMFIGLYFVSPRFKDIKRNLVVSMVVILYLMYPSMSQSIIGLFKCYQIEDGLNRMQFDMRIKCWSGVHSGWAFGFGLPLVLIWVVGVPLLGFLVLLFNRKRLHTPIIQNNFLMLYQGLRDNRFFWEFVNTIRKISLLSLNVIFPPQESFSKVIMALILLVVIIRLQDYLQPYKQKIFNELENREMISSVVTLFGGIIFIQEDTNASETFKLIIFIAIVVVNIWFYLLYIYTGLLVLSDKWKFFGKLGKQMNSYLRFKLELEQNSVIIEQAQVGVKPEEKPEQVGDENTDRPNEDGQVDDDVVDMPKGERTKKKTMKPKLEDSLSDRSLKNKKDDENLSRNSRIKRKKKERKNQVRVKLQDQINEQNKLDSELAQLKQIENEVKQKQEKGSLVVKILGQKDDDEDWNVATNHVSHMKPVIIKTKNNEEQSKLEKLQAENSRDEIIKQTFLQGEDLPISENELP